LRSSRRGIAATISAAVVAVSLPALAVLAVPSTAAAAAPGQVRITEWAYNGIEFFELTNVGRGAADLSGWSYTDSANVPGAVDLSSFGRVAPGESVVVSELSAAAFRTAWGLPDTVKVLGGNAVNLGRSDEINIYDASDALVDKLTYNDDGTGAVDGPRTDTSSAWVPEAALGANTANAWVKSTAADAEASWQSTTANFYGSPGISTLGGYDARTNNSADGVVRITEWQYNGSEFFELTNIGAGSTDLTGWSFSDNARTPAPAPASLDLSAFGTVAAGESVVVAQDSAATFRAAWGVPDTVKVIGGNGINLGRDDEINIYDDADALVDRLTFNDQGTGTVAGPRTDNASAWVTAKLLGKNDASGWVKSTSGDAEGSWKHATLDYYASPGVSNFGFVASAPGRGIRINEIESNGDVVGDWVELTNTGSTAVDVSGWQLRDNDPTNVAISIPSGTTIAPGGFYARYTEAPSPGFGLSSADEVTLYLADGTTEVDSYAWTTGHAATTYGRCPDGTGDFRVTTVATRGAPNACSPIRLNEVDTASTPGRVEIVNLSDAAVDITGWVIKDSTDTDATTLPASSSVPAHGYLVVPTTATLGPVDSVRLFDGTSALIDSVSWTAAPSPSLGRCADGVGAFKVTSAVTIGAVNQCPGVQTVPWPGSPDVSTSDDADTVGQDASGLAFDPTSPGTLWVAQNKVGTLTKMRRSGSTWVPADGWSVAGPPAKTGKDPRYADGTGQPDTEGITVTPDGAVYLAAERDNADNGVSKNTVLRYDAASATGATLNATDEWALNAILPTVGPNLGLEGITWVPDSVLVAGGFVDDSTHAAYTPSTYPSHGTGLFVVAVEGTGMLYVLALDQTAAVQETAHLVATVDPKLLSKAGPATVMDVSWDPELQRLWAVCDDSCDGTTVQLKLSGGDFVVDTAYERPAGMPNLNNEGFALAPQSTCVAGAKEVVWSDDGDTGGHALRSGTFPCTVLPSTETPGGGGGGTGTDPGLQPAQPVAATVSGAATSVVYGRATTVPVTVTAPGATPAGTVTLASGSTVIGSATLANGTAAVALPAKGLEPGTHQLTVAYSGGSAVAAGSGTATVTVTRAKATVVKPVVKPKKVVADKTRATLLISVRATGVTPTGKVTVTGGGLKKETATLKGGKVEVELGRFGSKGTKKLTVTYVGDDHVSRATTTVKVTVKPAKRRR
jgi:hypothetical protein